MRPALLIALLCLAACGRKAPLEVPPAPPSADEHAALALAPAPARGA